MSPLRKRLLAFLVAALAGAFGGWASLGYLPLFICEVGLATALGLAIETLLFWEVPKVQAPLAEDL